MADPGGCGGCGRIPLSSDIKFFERLHFGHCGETAEQIRMPFGVIGRTGPGMRQVVGFVDRSTGRGTCTFGVNLGRAIEPMGTNFRSDAALFPNYFGQTCCSQ